MRRFKLSNKLQVITLPTDSKITTVLFAINAGSNDEPEQLSGITHFLEHMIFEGTKNYGDALELSRVVDNIGGELNAATSKNRTFVYVRVGKRFLPHALDVVSDMVVHPTFEDKAFKKEKQIILHEIQQYEDDPKHKQWNFFEEHLFAKHPAKKPIAGTKDSVSKITIDDLKGYHKQIYSAENSILLIHGSVPDDIQELCEKYFKDMQQGEALEKQIIIEKNKQKKKKLTTNIQQAYYILGYKTNPTDTKEQITLDVIEAILSKGQTGWLFDEFRIKRALGYDVRAVNESEPNGSFFAINIVTNKTKIPLVRRTIKELFERLQKIDEETLKDAKNHITGRYMLAKDDPISYLQILAEHEFDTVKNYAKLVREIEIKDIKQVAKKILTESHTETILGP